MTDVPGPPAPPRSDPPPGHPTEPERAPRAARWFSDLTHAISGGLRAVLPSAGPLGVLRRGLEPTFVGFCLVSLSGFLVDVGCLWLFKGVVGLAFPVAVSMSYAVASLFNFAVNRLLNFQAHGHLGGQTTRWVVAAASNYLLWILGLAWLLEHLGVQYLLARMSVTVVEVLWLYTLSRLWVFRGVPTD